MVPSPAAAVAASCSIFSAVRTDMRHSTTNASSSSSSNSSSSRFQEGEPAGRQLEVVRVSGTPFEVGCAVGRQCSGRILDRLAKEPRLHSRMVPFLGTEEGRGVVEAYAESNRSRYPRHWEELRGIADGNGASFEEILLLNLRKEIEPFLPLPAQRLAKDSELSGAGKSRADEDSAAGSRAHSGADEVFLRGRGQRLEGGAAVTADECSDVLLRTKEAAIVGHNEDADESNLGNTFLLEASLDNGCCFTAYVYPGELPSVTFGFNSHGIAFSTDAVPPSASEVVVGGIGRNFVARDLLEAVDLDDALKRVSLSDLAVGHHYSIMDVSSRRILSVETASRGRISVREIGGEGQGDKREAVGSSSSYFHANSFLRLPVPQVKSESTIRREETAREKYSTSIQSLTDVLQVLGDTSDERYPIFSKGLSYMEGGPRIHTLHTAVFDLVEKKVSILNGNPRLWNVVMELPL